MSDSGQSPPASPPDWVRATEHAAWHPRDSAGEVVFRDRMWLLGGWFDSYSEPPRDVWSSADGASWERCTARAPWKHSDLPTSLVFQDRIRMMGGWPNEPARHEHSAYVFRDRLWVAGGMVPPLVNDVWYLDLPTGWPDEEPVASAVGAAVGLAR